MIDIKNFESIVSRQISNHNDYPEHILRVHLLAYSVLSYIEESKKCCFTLGNIQHGYMGLIRKALLDELLDEDPFDLRNVNESDFGELQECVRLQIAWLIKNIYTATGDYQDSRFILHELSFTDPDAVERTNPTTDDSSLGKCEFRVAHEKLSEASYLRLADYYLSEFYIRAPYLSPGKKAIEILAREVPLTGSLISFSSGYGDILVELSKAETEFSDISARPSQLVEGFLCELNLWTVSNRIGECSVFSCTGDVYNTLEGLHYWDETFDTAIGFASPRDSFDWESVRWLPHFNQLLPSTCEYPEAYVTALLAAVNPNKGKIVVGVPLRLLYTKNALGLRRRLCDNQQLAKVIEIDDERSSWGPVAILSVDLNKDRDGRGTVEFITNDQSMTLSTDLIRSKNPDLDLRPGRFIGSVEYKYQAVLALFDEGILDGKLRAEMTQILEALEQNRDFKHLFNPARKVLEAIFHSLLHREQEDSEMWKYENVFFTENGGINFESSRRFLYGQPVERYKNDPSPFNRRKGRLLPNHVNASAINAQKLTNPESHYYKDGQASSFAFKSAVFSLLHLIEWFKSLPNR